MLHSNLYFLFILLYFIVLLFIGASKKRCILHKENKFLPQGVYHLKSDTKESTEEAT